MQYNLPRPVFNKLEENLGDRQSTENLASSIEAAVNEIGAATARGTVEKMSIVKSEIKKDLSRTLVTRELFEERINSIQNQMDQRFAMVDQKFALVDEKFNHLEEKIEERFKRTDLKFHLLIGICIAGFSLFNPGFIEIVSCC